MGSFHGLLERLGYVRLRDFGLILTPDRRVFATRPAILDDGAGGRIVGWMDDDLAAMELEPWDPGRRPGERRADARPLPLPRPPANAVAAAVGAPAVAVAPAMPAPTPVAAAPAVARPVAVAPVAARPVIAAPVPAQPAAAPIAAVPGPVAAIAPKPVAPAAPLAVAAKPVPEEEDWEWEIAAARARAVPCDPVAPPRAAIPTAAAQWLTQEPLVTGWSDDETRIRSVTRSARQLEEAPPPSEPSVEPTRRTVIPVPTMPSAVDPRMVRLAPVTSPRAEAPRRRLARGSQSLASSAVGSDAEPTVVAAPRLASGGARRAGARS